MVQDARAYAESFGVSKEEAMRRMEIQNGPVGHSVSGLEHELNAKEQGTFAGLYFQNRPQYRAVFLFTRDGEQTIRPYIEGCETLEDLIEVRPAAATLAELESAQADADRLVDELGIPTESYTDVNENRVEVLVTDRARFEDALREADARLPEHVEVIEVEGLAEPAVPTAPDSTTAPASDASQGGVATVPTTESEEAYLVERESVNGREVIFIKQEPGGLPAGVSTIGEFMVDGRGCLRVRTSEQVPDWLLWWPPEYTMSTEGGEVRILDGKGRIAVRVGDVIEVSGASASLDATEECGRGPYWAVGTEVDAVKLE